ILAIGLCVAIIIMGWLGMQILTRSRGEKAGFRHYFFVAILPLVLTALVFAGGAIVLSLPLILPMIFIKGWREGRQFRRLMEGQGRFAWAKDLESKLAAGQGTLIEERGPKSVERIWYTGDDVQAQGSPPNWDELLSAWKAGHDHPFN